MFLLDRIVRIDPFLFCHGCRVSPLSKLVCLGNVIFDGLHKLFQALKGQFGSQISHDRQTNGLFVKILQDRLATRTDVTTRISLRRNEVRFNRLFLCSMDVSACGIVLLEAT